MNLLPQMGAEDITNPKEHLYHSMLSNCVKEGSVYWAKSTLSELHNHVPYEAGPILRELLSEGKIRFKKGRIQLAYVTHYGKLVIAAPPIQDSAAVSDKTFLHKLAGYGAHKGRHDYSALFKACTNLYLKTDYTRAEGVQFYRDVHTLVCQEEPRPFLVKEQGQLTTMLKLFKPLEFLDMVIEYFVNCERYVRTGYPSLGLFMYHKDSIFSQVKEHTRRDKLRKTKTDDEF